MAKLDPSIFQTINPATGEVIESFRNFDRLQIERVLNRSVSSFTDFRRLTVYRRAELLLSLATALRRNREVLAATVTQEMGKIIAEAEAEVEKCAQQAENGMQSMDHKCLPIGPLRPGERKLIFLTGLLVRYSPLCLGTFPCGR